MDSCCREACGLVGVLGVEDAALVTYLGLHALQHRGQESAGIVATDGDKVRSIKGMGLLAQAIAPESIEQLPGHTAIGHVRYSTTGASKPQNIQPLVISYSGGLIAIAHNGNLVNARKLRDEFEAYGSIFQTSTDSEIIVHLLAHPSNRNQPDPIGHCLNQVRGAFCFLFLHENRIIAARDPRGFRPLSLARLDTGWIVASETVAFDLVGAEFEREIRPGEMVTITPEGVESHFFSPPAATKPAYCIFEHIYFARPDSTIFGENVHQVRHRLGKVLAQESMVDADVVVAVPDSGYSAALGYCHASGLPLDRGLIRNHYVGRTFLLPVQQQRVRAVSMKHNAVPAVLRGKRVVLVDDSLIRGTTVRGLVGAIRDAGAREVHMRVSCPPNRHPCYYGIDFPTHGELIASRHTIPEMERLLGVDSLRYISLAGMLSAVRQPESHYCTACFNGEYPLQAEDDMDNKYSMDQAGEELEPQVPISRRLARHRHDMTTDGTPGG